MMRTDLKVLQVPFCFAPDPIGGTEVYVASVAQQLKSFGVDSVIVAPGPLTREYATDGLRVRRFAVSPDLDLAQLYGEGDPLAAEEFSKILDEERPELVHLHALTPAVSLQIVRSAKRRKIPVVFTYHTPTVTCQRGTLMRWGFEICEGALDVAQCSACTLQGAGIPRPLAVQIGKLSPNSGSFLGRLGLKGGIWTALRTSELVHLRHTKFHELAAEVDHFVAVCNWVHDLLQLNSVPSSKISVSRQGISWSPEESRELTSPAPRQNTEMNVAFVGRLDSTKGLHVLIDAFRLTRGINMRLDVYGVVQTPANAAYRQNMLKLARDDLRITFCQPLAASDVVSSMRQYDFLAVPSQTLETGPMVVLEAFAAGTPVIGEKRGGVAEIVRDGVDGILIDRDAQEGWADALRRLARNPDLRAKLRAGVLPPKTSRDVAMEMGALYSALRNEG